MYIIDSSVWVSLFLDFDINHIESKQIFEKLGNSKIVLPYCVINEVSSVLTYKGSKDISNNFLRFIKNNNDIFIENDNIFEEIDFFIENNSKVSFTDLAVIKIAKDYLLDLITFDKQMANIYKRMK
ncbi:MAG: PIN domain-containing protein [Candidatus Gracilibacteria bacterium]|nr:PIN domain-containing protein [Candidatus Gracilibacteria bacterium]